MNLKSSQVNTLPKAKSKTRSKQNKDMHAGLESGGRVSTARIPDRLDPAVSAHHSQGAQAPGLPFFPTSQARLGRVEAAGVGHVVSRPQHGGDAHAPAHEGQLVDPVNVAGCYRKAEDEMNKWIAKDMSNVEDGLHGTIDEMKG